MLERFAEDIWIAAGPAIRFIGVPLPTRMIVVRLGDGSVWINSPTPASCETRDAISAIGPTRFLVAPTGLHVWRLEQGHRLFPGAALWGPPNVTRAQAGIPLAGRLGDVAPPEWADDLDQLIFKGSFAIHEVEFLHKRSRTIILADLIQNYPDKPHDVVGNSLKRLGGVLNGGVPLDIRMSFAMDRARARRSLERLLSWDFDKLIVAHGACINAGARTFVENAFRWLDTK